MKKDAGKILKSQNKEAQQSKSIKLQRAAAIKKELLVKEHKQSIQQGQVLGLIDPDADPDVLVKSLEKIEPLYNVEASEERIDNKILSIMLMEGMQRDYQGKMLPNFTMAAKLVGHSKSYMHDLWDDREYITAQKNTLLAQGLSMVQVKLTVTMLKMVTALDSVKDWSKYISTSDPKTFKNFIDFFDKILLRTRLLGNLSTENVDTHIKHEGRVKLVTSDDALLK